MIYKTSDNKFEIKRVYKINESDNAQLERIKKIKLYYNFDVILRENDYYLLCNNIDEAKFIMIELNKNNNENNKIQQINENN